MMIRNQGDFSLIPNSLANNGFLTVDNIDTFLQFSAHTHAIEVEDAILASLCYIHFGDAIRISKLRLNVAEVA